MPRATWPLGGCWTRPRPSPAAWIVAGVGESSHGPRRFRCSLRRVWKWEGKALGRAAWLIMRETVDGRELCYSLSNAPATLEAADLLQVVGRRWGIEAELRLQKSDLGLDDYDVRSWPGWYPHVLLCLLAGPFLLEVQQEGGKKVPGLMRSQVVRAIRKWLMPPPWSADEILTWVEATQAQIDRAKRSHTKRWYERHMNEVPP